MNHCTSVPSDVLTIVLKPHPGVCILALELCIRRRRGLDTRIHACGITCVLTHMCTHTQGCDSFCSLHLGPWAPLAHSSDRIPRPASWYSPNRAIGQSIGITLKRQVFNPTGWWTAALAAVSLPVLDTASRWARGRAVPAGTGSLRSGHFLGCLPLSLGGQYSQAPPPEVARLLFS